MNKPTLFAGIAAGLILGATISTGINSVLTIDPLPCDATPDMFVQAYLLNGQLLQQCDAQRDHAVEQALICNQVRSATIQDCRKAWKKADLCKK